MRKLLLFLLAVVFVSCTKKISIDIPVVEESVVLNSILKVGQPAEVSISTTHSPYTDTIPGEKNAIVLLQTARSTDTLNHIGNGWYKSNDVIDFGTEYLVEATTDKTKVSATDCVPKCNADFSLSPFTDFVGVNESNEKFSSFEITLKDNTNQTDFYEIKVEALLSDGTVVDRKCWAKDDIIDAEGITEYSPNSLIFSDALICGEKRILVFFNTLYYVDSNTLIDPNYRIIVHVRSVSENYYKYKKKLAQYNSSQEHDIWTGVGDPVMMFDNVEGGYGVFVSYAEIIDTITKAR